MGKIPCNCLKLELNGIVLVIEMSWSPQAKISHVQVLESLGPFLASCSSLGKGSVKEARDHFFLGLPDIQVRSLSWVVLQSQWVGYNMALFTRGINFQEF